MEDSISLTPSVNPTISPPIHKLHSSWTLWVHLPHDTDWSLLSYKKILVFTSIEEAVTLMETLPHKMIKNCMLFLMRTGINPTWEDAHNRMGGSFSYKVSNKTVPSVWKELSYNLVGESLGTTNKTQEGIMGITISPKKNFCVLKIWMTNCSIKDPTMITIVGQEIVQQGCLFKKHNPNN